MEVTNRIELTGVRDAVDNIKKEIFGFHPGMVVAFGGSMEKLLKTIFLLLIITKQKQMKETLAILTWNLLQM